MKSKTQPQPQVFNEIHTTPGISLSMSGPDLVDFTIDIRCHDIANARALLYEIQKVFNLGGKL